jgi:hypothetical protein
VEPGLLLSAILLASFLNVNMKSALSSAGWRRPSLALVSGLGLVAAVRLLTRPFSLWEYDEFLFVAGIERFDPVQHRPHPPGYPLLIGLGKLFRWVCGDAFHALVALAVVSSLIGFVALFLAFRHLAARTFPDASPARAESVALAGALLFHLSPAMLVHGPMPMSDPPMLMFLSLALWAATRLEAAAAGGRMDRAGFALALGAFGSAAIGCRPQVAVAVLPLLAVAALLAPGWRKRGWVLLGFVVVSLAWFVPLLAATGGPAGFVALLGKQGALVARFDSGEARLPWSRQGLAFRFIAHPWGDRWTSFPVLALAAVGGLRLLQVRPRATLPLATLGAVHLAFCLAVMEPRDGVRYALPAVIAVAFAAATGVGALAELAERRWLRRAVPPWVVLLPAAALIAGFAFYTGPLLAVRSTTDSPTVQAARWVERSLSRRAVFLAEPELEVPALHLLRERPVYRIAAGLETTANQCGVRAYLLGDGESVWKEAKTFRWPESDAYGKLTRGHYRVVSVSHIPPAWRYVPLGGVYGFEPNLRERGLRWLAPEASIRVVPRCGNAFAVTLALPGNAPWPSNRVSVWAAGAMVQEEDVPRGGRVRFVVPLPQIPAFDISFRSRSSFRTAAGRAYAVQLVDVELLGH